jgi:hypothetical protein
VPFRDVITNGRFYLRLLLDGRAWFTAYGTGLATFEHWVGGMAAGESSAPDELGLVEGIRGRSGRRFAGKHGSHRESAGRLFFEPQRHGDMIRD